MPREMKCLLNEATLHDLIAVHLQAMGAVPNSEDITIIAMGGPNGDGTRHIVFKLEPKTDIIQHE